MLRYFESELCGSATASPPSEYSVALRLFPAGWTGCGFGVRKLVSGEIEDVLPLEDEEPLKAANPVAADGQVRFDALKVQARHDAIVKNVLKEGSFGLTILGGDHDLSENVRRLVEGKGEYVRVTTKRFQETAGE